MKRLALIIRTADYGGMDIHTIELIRRIDFNDYCLTVLCYGPDYFSRHFAEGKYSNVKVFAQESNITLFSYIRNVICSRYSTFVFVKGFYDHYPWWAYLFARMVTHKGVYTIEHSSDIPDFKSFEIRIVTTMHHFLKRYFGWVARCRLVAAVQGCFTTCSICVSDAIRKKYIDQLHYPERKLLVVHNGVDSNVYHKMVGRDIRKNYNIPSDTVVLLCVARLSAEKGLKYLISGFSSAIKFSQNCILLIVGDGPLRNQLIHQVESLLMSEHVFFVGFQEDVKPFLNESDIFILTSKTEGLPLTLLEAMAFKLPCIASSVGGVPEIIEDGKNGILVEPGNIDQISSAIQCLVNNADIRKIYGDASCELVVKNFNIDTNMKRILDVICYGDNIKQNESLRMN